MTTTAKKQHYDDMLNKMANESAIEWIDGLISATERGVRELTAMRQRFVESTNRNDYKLFASPVEIISWTVNEVQNIQRNYRLDLAVNHAAALSAAANRRES